jgi:hypothetical protein
MVSLLPFEQTATLFKQKVIRLEQTVTQFEQIVNVYLHRAYNQKIQMI